MARGANEPMYSRAAREQARSVLGQGWGSVGVRRTKIVRLGRIARGYVRRSSRQGEGDVGLRVSSVESRGRSRVVFGSPSCELRMLVRAGAMLMRGAQALAMWNLKGWACEMVLQCKVNNIAMHGQQPTQTGPVKANLIPTGKVEVMARSLEQLSPPTPPSFSSGQGWGSVGVRRTKIVRQGRIARGYVRRSSRQGEGDVGLRVSSVESRGRSRVVFGSPSCELRMLVRGAQALAMWNLKGWACEMFHTHLDEDEDIISLFCFLCCATAAEAKLSSSERSSPEAKLQTFKAPSWIYACSERNLFAFENNGSIAWSVPLNYTCDVSKAPVHGPTGMIYLVAENRVLEIDMAKGGDSKYVAQVFFGHDGSVEIIGLTVSVPSFSIFINLKNRGLFSYTLQGHMIWSAGPVLFRSGYRQGCKKNVSDCFFTSVPVVDHCEACLYISNTEGQLYSIATRSPYFKWIQDFSSFDTHFIVTPGNNGRLYVTIPVRALVFALDVTTGNILWNHSIGPLNSFDCEPVVDSNGWLSIGSLDGLLYTFSANGVLQKFSEASLLSAVIQVSPLLDCSGFGVYVSQTEVEGKVSRTLGNYTYVSAMKTRNAFFSLLVPAERSIYWSETYHGQFASLFSESDLHHFVVDERLLLALVSASNAGNPLQCRTTSQRLASSCSRKHPKHYSVFGGNERIVVCFLFLQTILLVLLAGLVRFCCVFWKKKKIQGQTLQTFFEKRRYFQQKKKILDRTISELQQKAAAEAVANTVILRKLSDLLRVREGLQKKLSTTYSLGRDAGVYVSQTEVEGKVSRTLGNYTYVSAMKTRSAFFSLLVPAERSIYWSETYHGQFASLFSASDLHHFVVDERLLLALVSASNAGNPLQCRTTSQRLASSCSRKHPKHFSVFGGNERIVVCFLFLQTILLVLLAGLVRFCCIFWKKKKIQGQTLQTFFEKRRSFQQKKKILDRTILELQQKAAAEAVANTVVLRKLSDLLRVREGLQKKLSTTYSLGRDA
uniref:Protein GAMETE EXPRESSED 3 n=1 Tax=Kalanchoe fedtschenkoi TaxID=63787 RepID=A0A7N1A7R5_KALFE